MFSDNTRAKEHSIIACSNAFTHFQRTHCPKNSARSEVEAVLALSKGSGFSTREQLMVKTKIEFQKPVLTRLFPHV